MSDSKQPGPGAEEAGRSERVGEALRAAVERTLAATAGSAADTRQRAGELLDEIARRGVAARDQVGRRGEAAREEVVRRGEEATSRLADAIAEIGLAERNELRVLSERIRELEGRLGALERLLRRDTGSEPDVEREGDAETPRGADHRSGSGA